MDVALKSLWENKHSTADTEEINLVNCQICKTSKLKSYKYVTAAHAHCPWSMNVSTDAQTDTATSTHECAILLSHQPVNGVGIYCAVL